MDKTMLISVLFIIEISTAAVIKGPLNDDDVTKRDVSTTSITNLNTTDPAITIKTHYIDIPAVRDGRDGLQGLVGEKGDTGLAGPPGPKGDQGLQGPPGLSTGGAIYTRWGRTTCPETPGTELVYEGLAGGSYASHSGGANYLCLPKKPEYLTDGIPPYVSYLYGAEYQETIALSTVYNYNVPCSICYVDR